MHKKMTITLDEAVYEGLYRVVGRRKMSQFIEDLLRPHVLDAELEADYKAMAADEARNKEIELWNAAEDADFANSAW
jgi:predicted CopG family antitoxin